MNDSKHFFLIFFFSFHFVRNFIIRFLLYHLFQFVDYNTLVCFNSIVIVFYDSYVCLYVAICTLIIVHIIDLYFVRFCINSHVCFLSLISFIYCSVQRILVQIDIFFNRIKHSQQNVQIVRFQNFCQRIVIARNIEN